MMAATLAFGPLPALGAEPETAEMREARRLLEEAQHVEKDHPNKAHGMRRDALGQLEKAWQVHKEPVALFRAALLYGRVLEQPVAAAQAAERYLAAMEYKQKDVDTDDARKRQAAAEEMVRVGLKAARGARQDPHASASCQQATAGPVEGILRVDDPTNQQFLLIRETTAGEVFVTTCDVSAPPGGVGPALLWTGVGVTALGAAMAGVAAYYWYGAESESRPGDFVEGPHAVERVEFGHGMMVSGVVCGAVGLGLIIAGVAQGGGSGVGEQALLQPTVDIDPRGALRGVGLRGRF